MVEFVAIISFIAGVLQIILFFKVWGMTNDIRELKEDHFRDMNIDQIPQKANFARINLILGNKDKVKTMFLKNFITYLDNSYTKREDSIRPYKECLRKQLKKIGEEMPEYIEKLETYGDYYSMFTKNDFAVRKESK